MRKMTLSLSDKDFEMIEALAKNRDKGKSDVLREALTLANWYEQEKALGSKILVERKGGQLREVERV